MPNGTTESLTCPLSQYVNTEAEGFVLKAKVHSAKVMDWDAIKTLVQRADEHFSHVSNTCGWTSASVAKTRARSGH